MIKYLNMKVKKYIVVIIVCLIMICIYSNVSFAGSGVSGIIEGMSGVGDDVGDSGISNVINNIIYMIQVAGTGISLIVITILGIKYMLSSVEEKAEVKKHMMPLLIGAVLLFGAVNIMKMVYDFTTSSFGG